MGAPCREGLRRRQDGAGETRQRAWRCGRIPDASSRRPCYLFRDSDCIRFPDKVASSFAEGRKGSAGVKAKPGGIQTRAPRPGSTAPGGLKTTENTLASGLSRQRRNSLREQRVPAGATAPWCPDVPLTSGWLPRHRPTTRPAGQRGLSPHPQAEPLNYTLSVWGL